MKAYEFIINMADRVSGPAKRMGAAMAGAGASALALANRVDVVGKNVHRLGGLIPPITRQLSSLFAAAAIGKFVIQSKDAIEQQEILGTLMTQTLGSGSIAQRVMKDISDFTSSTPFQVNQLTDSWLRLAQDGFRPSMEEMGKLGNLASSARVEFGDVAAALLDATSGSFSKLGSLGIAAKKQGDQVAFTFRGVTTIVENNENAIRDYVLSLGEVPGVAGTMQAALESGAGSSVKLSQKMAALRLQIGQALLPVFHHITDLGADFAVRLQNIVKWIQVNREQVISWAKVLGWVAAAFIGIAVAIKVVAALQYVAGMIAVAWNALLFVLKVARIAMMAFNLAALLNPFVWIPLVIAGIAFLFYKLDGLRAALAEWAAWSWKNHPFAWIWNVLEVAFPKLTNGIKNLLKGIVNGFRNAFSFINEKVFKPFRKLFEKLFGFKGIDGIESPAAAVLGEDSPYGRLAGAGGLAGGDGPGKPMKERMDDVRGDARQMKNITINIDKLVETLSITTTTLGMSPQQVKAEMSRVLLSVVNDVNYQ
ncbi:MAG TPA: hypothetical protein PKD70_06195 [Saprospiraceae bacterium]|nr:hypothetical protein [Saprospiraceae bacterium]HMP13448.1 hypothetical protein [Saprospiraceae bacterium]